MQGQILNEVRVNVFVPDDEFGDQTEMDQLKLLAVCCGRPTG